MTEGRKMRILSNIAAYLGNGTRYAGLYAEKISEGFSEMRLRRCRYREAEGVEEVGIGKGVLIPVPP